MVIGSGASGVEAVETALQLGAGEVVMVARTDKWIIPRCAARTLCNTRTIVIQNYITNSTRTQEHILRHLPRLPALRPGNAA